MRNTMAITKEKMTLTIGAPVLGSSASPPAAALVAGGFEYPSLDWLHVGQVAKALGMSCREVKSCIIPRLPAGAAVGNKRSPRYNHGALITTFRKWQAEVAAKTVRTLSPQQPPKAAACVAA